MCNGVAYIGFTDYFLNRVPILHILLLSSEEKYEMYLFVGYVATSSRTATRHYPPGMKKRNFF